MVEIVSVKNKKDIKNFINFEDKLYNSCEYYVPHIEREISKLFSLKKNPNLISNEIIGFLAYQDGKVVGRIMGIINRVEKATERYVRIAYFDFINDSEVSYALLDAVKKWAVTLGSNVIIGPLGFNEFCRSGVLTEGYNQLPTVSESYNYPYYAEHMQGYGFKESKTINSYKVKLNTDFKVSDLFEEIEELLEKNNLKLFYGDKSFIVKNYDSKILDLLYKNSPLKYPTVMTDRVFHKHLKEIRTLFDDNDFCVITNEFDDVVACIMLQSNTSLELQATCGKVLMADSMYNVSVTKVKDIGILLINKDYFTQDVITVVSNFLKQNIKFKNICFLESNIWIDDKLKKKLEKDFIFINHKSRVIYEYKIK